MKLFHIIFFSIIFFSCEKPVDIKLNSLSTQLVVEGYIQQDYPAYVFLTKSESYFNSVDSNTLNNISVDDALVFVEREDGIIHKLTNINQNLLDSLGLMDTLGLPLNGLYIDLSYNYDNFSQIGYKYKLIVEWNGETIWANTSIPPQYPVDSVWVKRKDSLESDYKCYIWARINDPDTLGNSAIIHYKRDVGWKPIDPLFIPCAIPARTDNLVNGENFEAMFARSGKFRDEDGVLLPFYADRVVDGEFSRRDIVILRLSHVDQSTYKFWRSAGRMQDANGNPFSEPMNLSSNIQGGLGIWGGYGVSYYYIPIVVDTTIYDTYNNVSLSEIF
ncbi:MAG: hypothetical protein CMD14_02575 [Flavobacteriales bacterium]|nr:hypothetical protein [Flavobacteriales bacterium]|tara:strand:+ start:174 stop:1166 length:993 start_codon:yes stop_codon:yes gene_type:complete